MLIKYLSLMLIKYLYNLLVGLVSAEENIRKEMKDNN